VINEIRKDADQRMAKCRGAMARDCASCAPAGPIPSLLEHLMVDYYGSSVPLTQDSQRGDRGLPHVDGNALGTEVDGGRSSRRPS
jgi:hypothetical protein